MKKTNKKEPTTKKPVNYEASIKVFGRDNKVYKSKGASVKEVLENLKVEGKAGGICVLTISNGDKKRDRIMNAEQLFRLFSSSRLMREIALKNVTLLFDNI